MFETWALKTDSFTHLGFHNFFLIVIFQTIFFKIKDFKTYASTFLLLFFINGLFSRFFSSPLKIFPPPSYVYYPILFLILFLNLLIHFLHTLMVFGLAIILLTNKLKHTCYIYTSCFKLILVFYHTKLRRKKYFWTKKLKWSVC